MARMSPRVDRCFPGPRMRRAARDAAVAFALTLVLVGPAATGGSAARASDPSLAGERAAQTVESFEPAVPSGDIEPERALISGVQVEARVVPAAAGRAVALTIRNPAARSRQLRCVVALDRRVYPDRNPLARIEPPPQLTRVFSREVSEVLAPGEAREIVAPLPRGAGLASAEGSLRLAIEEI